MKLNNERKGCHDVFRAFLVGDATYCGKYDIPYIRGTKEEPNRVIAFSKALRTKDYNQWVHFFEDDYQFERVWNHPRKYLSIIKRFKGAILPDYSLYRDMPLAMQIWNIYRSRAIGVWLQNNEVEVIVNARFGDERTFDVCCDGIERGATIAVGSVGTIRDAADRKIFIKGVAHIVETICPDTIVIYGSIPKEIADLCAVKRIKTISFEGETRNFFSKEAI